MFLTFNDGGDFGKSVQSPPIVLITQFLEKKRVLHHVCGPQKLNFGESKNLFEFCFLSLRQIAFLGPLESRHHFGQKSKVV